jgi:hypothetical protein
MLVAARTNDIVVSGWDWVENSSIDRLVAGQRMLRDAACWLESAAHARAAWMDAAD